MKIAGAQFELSHQTLRTHLRQVVFGYSGCYGIDLQIGSVISTTPLPPHGRCRKPLNLQFFLEKLQGEIKEQFGTSKKKTESG